MKDTIAVSAADIHAIRAWAQVQARSSERMIEQMRGLLRDLDATERVLQVYQTFGSTERRTFSPPIFSLRNPFKPDTAKAFMWEALDLSVDPWLTTLEVQAQASKLRGSEIPIGTVRPALSDMRQGHLERRGHRVALKARITSSSERGIVPDADQLTVRISGALTSRDLDAMSNG